MRAILFDLDGTLLRLTREYHDLLAETFETVCGTVDDGWLEAYDEAFYDLFAACEPDPVRRAFDRVEGASDPDALAATLREREAEACEPPAGAAADLERLAASYDLGVLTNGVPEWQRYKLRAHDLERYVDVVVSSYEAGAHKPNVAPYRLAERRLPADAHAMVGDADADVRGAQKAGWAAHRYDGGGFGDLPDTIRWER
ncbi:HAD family hydrolase [Natribaculum luteum]|uniref:HAD family hydrolase n=1 Tax=Natribaculum luteum TaxID=1586232 RepID=A0ABD5P4A4_9EURY|nr:HAD family hydrolase [Natribaculum luteum]